MQEHQPSTAAAAGASTTPSADADPAAASEVDAGSETPIGVGCVTRSRAMQQRVDEAVAELEKQLEEDPDVYLADCILEERWDKKAKVGL